MFNGENKGQPEQSNTKQASQTVLANESDGALLWGQKSVPKSKGVNAVTFAAFFSATQHYKY